MGLRSMKSDFFSFLISYMSQGVHLSWKSWKCPVIVFVVEIVLEMAILAEFVCEPLEYVTILVSVVFSVSYQLLIC